MKRILLLFMTMYLILISIRTEAAPYCTYAMANPRIYRQKITGDLIYRTRLLWDVYIKASETGTYFYGSQLAFLCATPANYANRGTTATIFVDVTTGVLANVAPDIYVNTGKNWSGDKTNFGLDVSWNGTVYGNTWPVTDVLTPIATSYQLLCTVGIEVDAASASAGEAGLTFYAPSMPGGWGQVHRYKIAGETMNQTTYPLHYYDNPSFDQQLTNLYLGRMYCNKWGWSEYIGSGSSNFQPAPTWTPVYSTSVWDTVTFAGASGSAAPINAVTGGKANNLRVHPNADLAINYNTDLTVSGTTEINVPRGIIIKSHTTTPFERGQFLNLGAIVYNSGASFSVWASFPQNIWHYYCIPLQASSMTSVYPFKDIYMKFYEETLNHWKYVDAPYFSPDTNLVTMGMYGYAMWPDATTPPHAGTVWPSGPINYTNQSVNVSRTEWNPGIFNGWNLIGNPFTASIDQLVTGQGGLNALTTTGTIDPTSYFWNGTGYITYAWETGVGSGPRYAAPQQGFLVHVTSGTTGTVAANATGRVINNGTPVKDVQAIQDYLILTASANGIDDDAHILFNEGSTLGFDSRLDAYKLFGSTAAPNLYSRMDTTMAVNELPWTGINQVVPMGFYMGSGGTVSITATNLMSFRPGTKIWLEDKMNSTMNELTLNPVYSFTASPSDNPNRFVLHFYNPSYGIENISDPGMQIYSFEEFLYVKNLAAGTTRGLLQMYDMVGRKVFESNLKDTPLNKYQPGVKEGYYTVRLIAEDHTYNKKVYLK